MSEIPQIRWPPIFVDGFRYRGAIGLPGSDTLPVTLIAETGQFTTRYGILQATLPGELVYNGTLEDRQIVESDNANYCVTARFWAQSNLRFEIRSRRQDANNYISLGIDLANNLLYTSGMSAGSPLTKQSITHNWDMTASYSVDLWTFDGKIFAFVNNAKVIERDMSENMQYHGFSIYVPEIVNGKTEFTMLLVNQLQEQPDPQLEDQTTNLFVEFRRRMKHAIENPSELTWDTYKQARLLWDLQRNQGLLNSAWADEGYPVHEPSPETWFAD